MHDYTTDSFDAEMRLLRQSTEEKITKLIVFFQGIFAGMTLLYTITLNLSTSVSTSLVRVQDQSIRAIALLSALGALYACISAKEKCTHHLM